MMTKKPGPPVPPRPHTGLIKSRSESPITRTSSILVTTTNETTNKITSSSSTATSTSTASSEAGRTVIYKSPSFDLKKRQQTYEQSQQKLKQDQLNGNNLHTENQQEIPIKQQQQHLIISNINNGNDKKLNKTQQSSSVMQDDKMIRVDNKINRTEIVIINNDNKKNDNNNEIDKISPIPKPRTILPIKNDLIKRSSSNTILNNHKNVVEKSEITINNINKNSKFIEIENNLKNAAERLFTEIIVNQNNCKTNSTTTKTDSTIQQQNDKNLLNNKTEHCISVRNTPSPPLNQNKSNQNMNRTSCVNLLKRPEPEGDENQQIEDQLKNGNKSSLSINPDKNKKLNQDQLPIEKKVAFHEILISEIAAMRRNNSIDNINSCDDYDDDHNNDDIDDDHDNDYDDDLLENDNKLNNKKNCNNRNYNLKPRKRYPSGCSTDSSPYGTQRSRIRTSDWVEVGDNGKEVMLTSCHISLEDSGLEDEERLDDTSSGVGDSWDSVKDAEERMSLPGLPPLPKSLSGLELTGLPVHNSTGSLASLESQRGISPMSRITSGIQGGNGGTTTTSTLDTQLAVLRREMFGLRQLDLSLLSQLWALNESIQEFRTMLQEQDTLSPPSPSPSPSDANSVSSCDEDDIPLKGTAGKSSMLSSTAMQSPLSTSTLAASQQSMLGSQILSGGGGGQLPSALQRMRSAPPPPPPTRKAPQRPV